MTGSLKHLQQNARKSFSAHYFIIWQNNLRGLVRERAIAYMHALYCCCTIRTHTSMHTWTKEMYIQMQSMMLPSLQPSVYIPSALLRTRWCVPWIALSIDLTRVVDHTRHVTGFQMQLFRSTFRFLALYVDHASCFSNGLTPVYTGSPRS